MKYYVVAKLDVTDRGWVQSYVQNVTKMVEAFGGRYPCAHGERCHHNMHVHTALMRGVAATDRNYHA